MEALERLYASRLAEQVDRLAHHALRGEVWDKAVAYFRQAGAKAAARSAYREAVTCFEHALTALAHCPEGHDTFERGVDLRFDLQSALIYLGELGQTLDVLREAEKLAEALRDQRRLAKVWAHMTHCFWWMGDADRAVEYGQRARAVATALGDTTLEVLVNIRLGQAFFTSGEFRRAIEVLDRDTAALEGEVRPGLLAVVIYRNFHGWCLAALGDFETARTMVQESFRAARVSDHPYNLAIAYNAVAGSELTQGNLHEAVAAHERGLELCNTKMFTFLWPWHAGPLGKAYALSGRVAEAVTLLEQTVEREASMRLMMIYPRDLTALGEACLLAGRRLEAIQYVQQALNLARVHRQRAAEAEALRVFGEIHSSRNPPDAEQAAQSYGEARVLAGELGMRPLVAHCHLGLGRLYRRTGDQAKGGEHLAAATTLYGEMDMRFWLVQAQAEMRALA